MAWHAAQAGERLLASTMYLYLAEAARELHNYLEADLLYTHALAQLEENEEDRRLQAHKGRGIVRYRLGRYEGSSEDLSTAEELAVRVGDAATQADVMLDESMALDWLFEWHRSRDLACLAQELVRGLEAPGPAGPGAAGGGPVVSPLQPGPGGGRPAARGGPAGREHAATTATRCR